MIANKLLEQEIALLPDKPGVYQMKDANDKIIYIGKAKNLKKRVSQYFLRPQVGKVAAMVSHIDHFETIIVHSDKEAFILEMNLIQTHYPRYNIMLMDDSHYPYIALRKDGDPYLRIARNSKDKNYYYFGPFPNSGAAYKTIDLLNKIYPTRKCLNIPKKACLYASLGECLAPCVKPIDLVESSLLYEEIKSFLNGDTEEVKKNLKEKMLQASEVLNFELAQEYKESLDAIEMTTSKQAVEIVTDKIAKDVIAYSERDGYRAFAILSYRNGLLLGKKSHILPIFGDIEDQMEDVIEQYYENHDCPKQLICRIEGIKEEVENIFDGLEVIFPKEGRLLSLIDMAELNARSAMDEHFASARLNDDNLALLEELGKILNIETPYRIELFDNSHLQGSSPVGAMVCFINGEPAKKMYRKFHLDEKDAGDDYHSMKEVTYRRYSRLKEEGSSFPDLILVDGGLSQIHATVEALEEAGVKIHLAGLFKNDRHETEGLIDGDGKVYPINSKSPLFFLLMRMQDEVHRFAITFHKQLRSKKMKEEIYDDIPGVGEKRKELIRKHYPTLEDLYKASEQELNQLLPAEAAKALYQKLHSASNH